ncbi:MAG TPA: glycoside hydrolase family 19 protein [Rhodoblastus sp.]|nr:glycoside hydrolase family 19 protein [Rhodoblastus sp.]
MTDYRKVLLAVCPHGKPAILDGFAAALPQCVDYADVSTPERLAAFIGQCAEESAGFQTTTEYASGRAYEGRKDLGNTQKGDGVRFRGRGLIQLTGRANYAAASKEMGVDFIAAPEKLAEFPYAAWVADRYWKLRNINAAIDRVSAISEKCRVATKIVNGGYNGLSVRQTFTNKAFAALKDLKAALTETAAEEKAKASSGKKGATVIAVAAPATASAAPAATSGHVMALLLVAAALAAFVGTVIFLSIRKHEDAAAALTQAAREA